MKYLLIIALLISVNTAYSSEADQCVEEEKVTGTYDVNTKVPKDLEGATVTITDRNGKVTKHKAEEFKVVPRKQQFITQKTIVKSNCGDGKKNRVSLLAGHGAQAGLNQSTVSSSVYVESRVGFIGGIQYQRKLSNLLSLGAQLQTNKTFSGILGIDF